MRDTEDMKTKKRFRDMRYYLPFISPHYYLALYPAAYDPAFEGFFIFIRIEKYWEG